ncbi:nuclear transport factor 2 family protein [Kineosporia succinea]
MNTDDRWAITETLALAGHVVDSGDLDRLSAVFASDVVYDMSAVGAGMPVITGTEAVRQGALRMGANGPVAHHVTNVVVVREDGAQAEVDSKACC